MSKKEFNNNEEVVKMAVPAEKIVKPCHDPSIEEMERILGLDKIAPIQLSESDLNDRELDEDYFKDWYREELQKLYAKHIRETARRSTKR